MWGPCRDRYLPPPRIPLELQFIHVTDMKELVARTQGSPGGFGGSHLHGVLQSTFRRCGDEVPVARVTLTLLPQSPLYLRR